MIAMPVAHSELIPPPELLERDGTQTPEKFCSVGDGVVREWLVGRALMKPTDRVLDLGCGSGSIARSLVGLVGSYDGVDIDHATIDWLNEHYASYPDFRFRYSDVHNKMYNPKGSIQPRDFRLPFDDESFDIVVLKSVFTHMLPDAVRNYLGEIARVLRPGGRAVISYFLLNPQTRPLLAEATWPLAPRIPWKGTDCMVADPVTPEISVAHDEARVREWYAGVGLTVVEIAFGFWPGRPSLRGLQDMVIALK